MLHVSLPGFDDRSFAADLDGFGNCGRLQNEFRHGVAIEIDGYALLDHSLESIDRDRNFIGTQRYEGQRIIALAVRQALPNEIGLIAFGHHRSMGNYPAAGVSDMTHQRSGHRLRREGGRNS